MTKINIVEHILSVKIFFLYDLKEYQIQAIRYNHYEAMTFLSMLTNSVA